MTRRRSLGRVLRSRRVAVWFLVGIPVWGFLGTLVPSMFSFPLFTIAMLYLAVSTSLCAWERTSHALEVSGKVDRITTSEADKVRHNPTFALPVRLRIGHSEARMRVVAALRSLRLRVTEGEPVIEGRRRRWGLFGSPVFHWSLALLIIVIIAGRLTRSEGFIGVPVGGSTLDITESYRGLEEGPLFFGHTGYEISVPEMDRDFIDDGGVHRGVAPVVVIREDQTELASQRVYPNSPLRYGQTMIHVSEYGLSPYISLETSTGVVIIETRPLLDLEEGAIRSASAIFDIKGEAGEAVLTVELSAPFEAKEPSLDVMVTDPVSGKFVTEARLTAGEALDLPDGERLRFIDTGDFALLSVVHDWSVPFIYVLLTVGLIGLSVAVLNPYRRLFVIVVDDEDGIPVINVLMRHGRAGVLFQDLVQQALENAVADSVPIPEEKR